MAMDTFIIIFFNALWLPTKRIIFYIDFQLVQIIKSIMVRITPNDSYHYHYYNCSLIVQFFFIVNLISVTIVEMYKLWYQLRMECSSWGWGFVAFGEVSVIFHNLWNYIRNLEIFKNYSFVSIYECTIWEA